MAKRDTDTELWTEDWFIDLKGKYQLFYYYVKDKCDHAGFWRPNFKTFEQNTGFRIKPKDFLEMINTDYTTGEKKHRERIRVLENGRWWIVGFIAFHFPILNLNNRYHNSVYGTFRKNVTCENTMQYGFEVKDTSKTPLREVKETSREQGEERREKGEEDRDINKNYRECSLVLRSRILEKRKAIIDDLKLLKWDNTVRLMVERDKYSTRDIIDTINACHDMMPRNGFTWADNILSMDTLRIRMKEGKVYPGMNSNNNNTKKIPPEPKPVVTPVEDRASPEELREIRQNINAISDKFSI